MCCSFILVTLFNFSCRGDQVDVTLFAFCLVAKTSAYVTPFIFACNMHLSFIQLFFTSSSLCSLLVLTFSFKFSALGTVVTVAEDSYMPV